MPTRDRKTSCLTSPAPYEKSKSLGSGGSMVARLKLKGIDGNCSPLLGEFPRFFASILLRKGSQASRRGAGKRRDFSDTVQLFAGFFAKASGAPGSLVPACSPHETALPPPADKIFLISRNEERLRQTEQDLQAAVPALRGVKSFAVDFSEGSTESLFQKLDAALKNLDVGILVNNVGVSYPHAMFYDELDLETLDQLINVNVRSTLVTTRVLYPGMVSRRRGAIICVGSGASEIASDPLYCAYSATKGAAEAFCRSLQPECASKNILVQCHVPLLVTTKLSKMRKTNLMTPSTEKYAKAAVAAIENGSLRGPTTISPYCVHRCIIWLSNAVPRRIWEAAYLPRCLSIRKRALKKKEQQAEAKKDM